MVEHDPAVLRVHMPVDGMKTPVGLLLERVTSPDGYAPVAVTAQVVKVPTFIELAEHEMFSVVVVFEETGVTVRLTVVVEAEAVAPAGLPLTMKLYEPGKTEDATLTIKPLEPVGVTGLTLKLPQVIPVGRAEQDNMTD